MTKPLKKALVCASGRGSNFQAVFHAIQKGKIRNCEIIAFVTDRKNTQAEAFAKKNALPSQVIDFQSFPSRSDFNRAFFECAQGFAPHFIMTLGYMRILSPEFTRAFPGAIINIHPSLLPSFKGLKAPRQALEYGVRFTGATVHFVDEGLDTGPIISQAVVPLLEQDNEESLRKRILEKEHELIVEAIDLYCAGRLKIIGSKVEILEAKK